MTEHRTPRQSGRSNRSKKNRKQMTGIVPAPVFEVIEPRVLLSTTPVTNADIEVTTAADSGTGSLRAAIEKANTDAGKDRIVFNIAGSGPHTIFLSSQLPQLTDNDGVVIDGTTQAGYAGAPVIGINGSFISGSFDFGLRVFSSQNEIRGLSVQNFDLNGIHIAKSTLLPFTPVNNLVELNYIGVGFDGETAMGMGQSGVNISDGDGNTIRNNVISGNTQFGVGLTGNADNNLIEGNLIGTNADGTAAVGNDFGIALFRVGAFGSPTGNNNTIADNLISGNSTDGIGISGFSTTSGLDNVIQGNKIGTDITGTSAIANGGNGISISVETSGTLVGGTASGEGNLIAFNGLDGVHVFGGANHTISGNSIHTNGDRGIEVDSPATAAPVITKAASDGVTTDIEGTLAGSGAFTIEFFSNSAADGSGFGEGETFLESVDFVDGGLNDDDGVADGVITINITLSAGATVGHVVSATATNAAGSTGNFSATGAAGPVVVPSNEPPTADAGGPYNVTEGGSVVLDGTGSSDPDQSSASLTYEWDLDGDGIFGETGAAATRGDETGASPTFFPNGLDGFAGSSVIVTLRVTDDGGLISEDDATITIDNAPPVITSLTGPTEGVRYQTLSYSAAFTDAGTLDTHTLDWVITDSASAVVATGSGSSIDFTTTVADTYTVTFTVTDDEGDSDSDSISVTIDLLAVAIDPISGQLTLYVGGSDGRDKIKIKNGSEPGELKVEVDEKDYDVKSKVIVGPPPVQRVIVFGGDGDDDIKLDKKVEGIIAEFYGGAGDDKLRGGMLADILVGGDGDDLLDGGDGRDILIGGLGEDKIVGDDDDDILVGGVTLYDDNRLALLAIAAEWNSANDYATRVNNLMNGTGLNGSFVLNDTTVFDDNAKDKISGKKGMDWFLANDDDDKIDNDPFEILTQIEIDFLTT